MKSILTLGLFMAVFAANVSFAQEVETQSSTTTVYATGRANRFCQKSGEYFCYQQIKDAAKADATRDARLNCESSQRGRLQEYSGSCYENCNPPNLPNYPGNPASTMVSCNASCNFRCDIP